MLLLFGKNSERLIVGVKQTVKQNRCHDSKGGKLGESSSLITGRSQNAIILNYFSSIIIGI